MKPLPSSSISLKTSATGLPDANNSCRGMSKMLLLLLLLQLMLMLFLLMMTTMLLMLA